MDRQRASNASCMKENPEKNEPVADSLQSHVVEGTPQHHEKIFAFVADSLQSPDPNPIFADTLKLSDTAKAADSQQTLPVLARHHKVVSAWPNDLVEKVQAIISTSSNRPPATPEFRFELSCEAAKHNAEVLQKYDYHLGAAIDANSNSPLGYGSEFRPIETLRPILELHPNWNRLTSLLTIGSKWPLEELDEKQRMSDLNEALAFGNHKGAADNPDLLRSLVDKDVTHGFGLVIPLSIVSRIPGALLAPMNIMEQNTIDEHGRIIPKKRLTHDQSFKWSSGTSVNSRVQTEKLLPCRFGACMRRLANFAVAARRQFPNRRILATKVDYKSAYRRCHLNWETAAQTITQLTDEELAIISLRLTFGGAPGPFEWGIISETICDLANALLHDDNWNPNTLSSPTLVPPERIIDDDTPFGVGKELIVDIPVDPRGTIDCYIDDTVGHSDNALRMERAPLLAIHTVSRPVHRQEPIPRDDMAAWQKLFAEGALEEHKIILGWLFDFCCLTVSLPENKFVAWSDNISSTLSAGKIHPQDLEQLIGRIGHLSSVVPMVYHFLSRLRDLHFRSRNRRSVVLTENCKKDLVLMMNFLEIGRKGVDINIIAYLAPTHVYYSDSCPAGLGGYSRDGFAWRFFIPPSLRFRASNNLLEFLAANITPWIDILAGRIQGGDCALSMTDSTTAEGWMHKTNFRERDEDQVQVDVRIEAARKFALDFTTLGIKSYNAEAFRDSSIAQRNRLVADLAAVETTRQGAVQGSTHENQARAWRRWVEYCKSIGLEDTYLDGFAKHQRIKLMGAFAMAMREGRFSGDYGTLAEGTVRSSISYVVSTFRENGRSNPTKDDDMELGWILHRLFRAFKNEDPKVAHQKAVPLSVISELWKRQNTETEKSLAQLTVAAYFFACRSCEYLKVPQDEKRRTDILKLWNIRFFKEGKQVHAPSPDLGLADSVSVTFEMQKNQEKFDTVTHGATNHDYLCPVKQWASVVNRIWSYPEASINTPVSAVWKYDRIEHLTSKILIDALRDAVVAVGEDSLGFKASEVGTHSIRSGAAMQMYLGECPVYTIMLIGRWSSDAFLRYIRKQIEQFSHNVSCRMLIFLSHRHIPDMEPRRVSHLDPRQRNNPSNAETRRNIGGDPSRRARLPAFAQFA